MGKHFIENLIVLILTIIFTVVVVFVFKRYEAVYFMTLTMVIPTLIITIGERYNLPTFTAYAMIILFSSLNYFFFKRGNYAVNFIATVSLFITVYYLYKIKFKNKQ